jgi:hypothetical protein
MRNLTVILTLLLMACPMHANSNSATEKCIDGKVYIYDQDGVWVSYKEKVSGDWRITSCVNLPKPEPTKFDKAAKISEMDFKDVQIQTTPGTNIFYDDPSNEFKKDTREQLASLHRVLFYIGFGLVVGFLLLGGMMFGLFAEIDSVPERVENLLEEEEEDVSKTNCSDATIGNVRRGD